MLKDYVFRILRPGYWTQINPTDDEWSSFVETAIDSGDVELVNEYRARVGGVLVWTGNYPYGYGSPLIASEFENARFNILPSARVRKKLRKALARSFIRRTIAEAIRNGND